jgi:hypothetical protein
MFTLNKGMKGRTVQADRKVSADAPGGRRVVHCQKIASAAAAMGQNPNASRTLVCQLPPAADIRRIGSGPLCADFVAKAFLHS